DRIEPRLQFGEQSDKFLGRKFYRWMIEQKINHFRAPQIIFEIVFAVRAQQFLEHGSRVRAFGNRFQKLRRRLRNGIIAQKSFAGNGFARVHTEVGGAGLGGAVGASMKMSILSQSARASKRRDLLLPMRKSRRERAGAEA